jgi:rhamnulokinase
MEKINFFAVDLGASSGRTILGTLENGKLAQREITRFPNNLIEMQGHFYWDIYALYWEIIRGLKAVAAEKISVQSIGIDTWGVDVALIGRDGAVLRAPYSYRDPQTEGEMEEYFSLVPKERVYEIAGIQFMNFNTLFQLSALHRRNDSALAAADKILFMPDALSYLLTGKQVTEYTIMSTSSMMDPRTGRLSEELIAPVGLSEAQFGAYVNPATVIGTLTGEVQRLTGLPAIPVVAVAGHDTASAVAAVPAEDETYAYLSSGTWSLMGIETPDAIINKESYEKNFTNEGGIEGTTRFLKNICGMWLLERSRKEWTDNPESYDALYAECEKVPAYQSLINPDSPCFANPSSMVDAIKNYCAQTGQHVPQGCGEQARCIYESLAMRYRQVFGDLQRMAPFPLKRLHVIGGGSLNYMLDQYIANSLGIPVIAGPAEGTAIGNIMLQAKAAGVVSDIRQMRQVIADSICLKRYEPVDTASWDGGYKKYLSVYRNI